MTDFSKLSKEELKKMDKNVLITIIGVLQSQLNAISSQLDFLTEQIALMNQRTFGRKTEQLDEMHQMTLFEVFNEPEVLSDDSTEPEISEIIISSHTRKKKTTREENLEGLPARIFEHTLSDEELGERFPDGYKELPNEVYKRLSIIPQTFIVDEHHVHVYASKNNDGTIVRAPRPADVFRNSIATPSLVAAIITGKYANHLPLDRQSRCYKDNGVKLETNTLANWMMLASEQHFPSYMMNCTNVSMTAGLSMLMKPLLRSSAMAEKPVPKASCGYTGRVSLMITPIPSSSMISRTPGKRITRSSS